MANSFFVQYNLDNGSEINIKISYENNVDERLNIGKLKKINNACLWSLKRKDIKPRYIIHKTYGKIYFKTHEEYKSYVFNDANKKFIAKAVGETLNCRMLNLLTL